MQLKVKINSISPNETIERVQNVNYDTFDIDKYKDMFQELAKNNFIIGNFENAQWQLPYNLTDYPITFEFNIEIYYKFNLALKAYLIVRLLSGRTPRTVYDELTLLKKTILTSDGFSNTKEFERLLDLKKATRINQAYEISIVVKRFLLFYKVDNYKGIINLCNNNLLHRRTVRDLPAFEDIMIFDDVVNNYFRDYPINETIEFLPIMMWWLLTNILPMRPSGFLLLEKNCLENKMNYNSPYRITIPRIKNESTSPGSIVKYETVTLDEKTYNLINNAIQKLKYLDTSDSNYLFPVEILTHFRKNNIKKKNKRINLRDFDLLKKHFYEKIVEGIYGKYDLEKIKSGDTRHFAIINMALQGFNMLSIARMAGHDEIKSQYSYFSHAEHFAQSYVYKLAQRKIENKISDNMANGIIGWKRYIYDKGKSADIADDKDIVGRINYGYCTEQKDIFPETCIEYCKFCSKFLFKPSVNEFEEATEWLTDSSADLEQKISESIDLMKDISSSLAKSFHQGNDDILKSTSRNLLSYMDMKATIDSKIMEVNSFVKKDNNNRPW